MRILSLKSPDPGLLQTTRLSGAEIRLDQDPTQLNIQELRKAFSGFLILTPRMPDPEDRLQWARQALSAGWNSVDLDCLDPIVEELNNDELQRITLSLHIALQDVESFLPTLLQARCGYRKIACPIEDSLDAFNLLSVLKTTLPSPWVFSPMGPAGEFVRCAPQLFGSHWSYIASPQGPTAEGQITEAELTSMGLSEEVPVDSFIYGILGLGVSHSLSPQMHNPWLQAQGQQACYLRFHTKHPVKLMQKVPNALGFSITSPHKKTIATAYGVQGACNTLYRDRPNSAYQPANTDVSGFLLCLHQRGWKLDKTPRIHLTGLGDLGKEILHCLLHNGYPKEQITYWNRSPVDIELLAKEHPWEVGNGDVLWIQTAAIGDWLQETLEKIDPQQLSGVIDANYGPNREGLTNWAHKHNIAVISGLEWLVGQGLLQQEYFTQSSEGWEPLLKRMQECKQWL